MASNIMELLKHIQRDLAEQKEYMRNLHVVNKDMNEKYNLVEAKLTNIDIEQQQVLQSVEKLVQQVKINNTLLFGNEGTEITVESTTTAAKSIVDPTNSPVQLELGNTPEVELNKDTELNRANIKNTEDNVYKTEIYTDKVDIISNEIKEMKKLMKDFVETCQLCKCNTGETSSTFTNADSVISRFDDKLNQITDLYTSDMKDLRESIKHFENTIKEFTNKTASAVQQSETVQTLSNYFSIEQINQLNAELKHVTDMNHSDIEEVMILMNNFIREQFNLFNVELTREAEEIKKLIKDCNSCIEKVSKFSNECVTKNSTIKEENGQVLSICTELKRITEVNKPDMEQVKELIENVARKLHTEDKLSAKQKTIQISPTYFSPDQISKLNSELKRIAENCQDTNVFSIIEVIPGNADEHPVMKHLRKGVCYKKSDNEHSRILFKLGFGKLRRSDFIDLITEYPDLNLYQVLWTYHTSSSQDNKWHEINENYNFNEPLTFMDGKFVPIKQ